MAGPSSAGHRRVEELEAKVGAAEASALEARRSAQLADRDAADKDRELSETLTRLRLYESVSPYVSVKYTLHCTTQHDARTNYTTLHNMTLELTTLHYTT